MKKIIFILALFVSFVANSQYTPPTGYTNINSRYDWLAGVFRALGLPAGGNAAFTTGQAQRAGSVYYDSTGVDAGLYVWSGSAWVGVGEVAQSALDDSTAAIRADHWAVRGNAIAQDTSKFIGTTDSAAIALRIRVNNYNAGYLGYAYQTSNPPYTNDGNNYTGDVAFGWRALDSTRKRIDAGIAGNGGSIAIGADALRDNTLTANVAIGNNAGKRGRTLHRNVIIGGGAFQFGYDGEFNVAVGQFAMEVQDGVDGNTGVGTYALRSNKMGGGHTAIGGFASSFGSAWVDAITVTNGGSGYTTATVTISAPDLATPGTSSVQATATATINSGAITAITLTNKGMGYSTAKNPVTVTITGDGTGATATATLRMAENNTSVGYVSSYFNTVGRRLTTVGAYSGYGLTSAFRTLVDDDMTLIGYNATRGDSRATSVPFINSTGVGSNVKVNCDSCFVLGPPEVSTTIGASTVDASAKLEITSTTKGFLPPRMSAAQRLAISSPATGLHVFDLDSLASFEYNGSAWQNLYNTGGGSGGGTWGSITGTLSDQTDLQTALDAKQNLLVNSAGLAAALSDETGTGLSVFNTTPTFATNITTPLIIGGTGTTQTLTYKTTTGVGATGADHIFQVGNNGGTTAMRILNSGYINFGNAASVPDPFTFNGPIRITGTSSARTALASSITGDWVSSGNYFRFETWGNNSSTRGGFLIRQSSSTGSLGLESFYLDGSGDLTLANLAGTADRIVWANSAGKLSTKTFVTLPEQAAPSTPASGYTSIYPKTDGLWYGKDDAGTEKKLSNSTLTKNINLPTPGSAENEFIFFTPVAITVTNTRAVLVGSSTPSVTYNIAFGTDRTSLTNVYTAGQTVTSTTTGTDASGVNDATIPANSWVVLTTSAQSGTVTAINASIQFTED